MQARSVGSQKDLRKERMSSVRSRHLHAPILLHAVVLRTPALAQTQMHFQVFLQNSNDPIE